MNINEWKEKQVSKSNPQYTHFDSRISIDKCFNYITNPEKITHHGFYPFIHYIIKNNRIKNGKALEPKKRQIYYAAHIDSWIYRYYSYLINEKYNERVHKDNIDKVAVAYRTDIKKRNIDFAKEAFEKIRELESCYIIIGDFTDFFDNLNHDYLKDRLCDLLSVNYLPSDFYAVFKNVTHFSYMELSDLLKINGLKDTTQNRKIFNHKYHRALSPKQLRNNKKKLKHNPNSNVGVPQGSPISATLANVYMLEFDKKINDYISNYNGLYMRYSDDFIIVLPKNKSDFKNQYINIKKYISEVPNITLKDEKTKIFQFENKNVINCTSYFTSNKNSTKNIIEFLGFSFDGKYVRIRDKTISKYYNRLYRKLGTIVKSNGFSKNNNKISCKNLYLKYSYKGSKFYIKKSKKSDLKYKQQYGNIFDYIHSAKLAFPNDPVDDIYIKHMYKIRKKLNKIDKNKNRI